MNHRRLLAVALCLAPFCRAAQTSDFSPTIGAIEVFGARKVSTHKILSALGVKPGDPFPPSETTEDHINKLTGVLVSRLEAVCCSDGGKIILYAGVEERGEPHVEFHAAPTGEARLPSELFAGYQTLLENVADSIRGKSADEDLTNGYSLIADPYARLQQQTFLPAAAQNLALLDRVVRESADPEQRAAAAYLLPYAPRGPRTSKVIADALQYALRDREDIVRKNAFRSLRAVAVGAKLHPEQEIVIEPTWFVELLNSMVWSDRHSAALALVELTEDRKPETLQLLRERALPSVLEMARWQNLDHALPAFILAGRMAGFEEKEIKGAWVKEDRESVLGELVAGRRHRHR